MARTFYTSTDASDLSSGGNFSNALADTQQAANSIVLTAPQASSAFGSYFTAAGVPGTDGTSTGTFTIRTNITQSNTGVNFRANLMRVNSAGTVQATVLGTLQAASTGTRTQTYTDPALGTWAAGDRLRVQYEIENTNAHGGDKGITFETGQLAQDTPFAAGAQNLNRSHSDTTSLSESVVHDHQPSGQNFDRFHADTLSTSDALDEEKRGPSQFVAPVADIGVDDWVGEDDRTSGLYTSISDASDATYIKSPQAPTSSNVAEFSLENAVDPETDLGHVLRYRYAAQGSTTLVVELVEGTTVLDSWEHIDPPSSPTDAEHALDTAVAASITDYTNLRVRFRGA